MEKEPRILNSKNPNMINSIVWNIYKTKTQKIQFKNQKHFYS